MKRSMVVCKYIVFMCEVASAVNIPMFANVYTGACLCEYKEVCLNLMCEFMSVDRVMLLFRSSRIWLNQ